MSWKNWPRGLSFLKYLMKTGYQLPLPREIYLKKKENDMDEKIVKFQGEVMALEVNGRKVFIEALERGPHTWYKLTYPPFSGFVMHWPDLWELLQDFEQCYTLWHKHAHRFAVGEASIQLAGGAGPND